MEDADIKEFDAFLERNWGIKPPKMIKYDENGNEIKPTVEKTQEEKIKEMSKDFSAALSAEAKRAIGKKVEKKSTTVQYLEENKSKRTITRKEKEQVDEEQIIRSEILKDINIDDLKDINIDDLKNMNDEE